MESEFSYTTSAQYIPGTSIPGSSFVNSGPGKPFSEASLVNLSSADEKYLNIYDMLKVMGGLL
jgi:hypothetical protein